MAARKHIELPLWLPRKLGDNELGTVRLLDIHAVCERISFSRAQVYEMMADGRFPRPIKFAPGRRGAVRWPDVWITEWLKLAIECAQPTLPLAAQSAPVDGLNSTSSHSLPRPRTTSPLETR